MLKKPWFYSKNIFLTGVSSGIGLEMAKIFVAKFACNVVGVGRNVEKLEKAKQEIDESVNDHRVKNEKNSRTYQSGSFRYKTMDVSLLTEWNRISGELDAEEFNVDIVINNAGVMLAFNKFENQSIEESIKVMNTNFLSHMYSYKTFIEKLKQNKGAMINIASSAATCPVVGAAVYGASKSAVKNFTETIAVEHKKEVYISCVMPGFTTTELFREEKELGKFVKTFAMSAEKMAMKIVNGIKRKKKRVIFGADAHLMSGCYRLAPKSTPCLVASVLKSSKDTMFDKIYPENIEKRKN